MASLLDRQGQDFPGKSVMDSSGARAGGWLLLLELQPGAIPPLYFLLFSPRSLGRGSLCYLPGLMSREGKGLVHAAQQGSALRPELLPLKSGAGSLLDAAVLPSWLSRYSISGDSKR